MDIMVFSYRSGCHEISMKRRGSLFSGPLLIEGLDRQRLKSGIEHQELWHGMVLANRAPKTKTKKVCSWGVYGRLSTFLVLVFEGVGYDYISALSVDMKSSKRLTLDK